MIPPFSRTLWKCLSLAIFLCLVGEDRSSPATDGKTQELFREIAPEASGITWVHENGKSGHRYLPEMAGAGVAIFDYNNDGWMDILFVNSGPSSFYQPVSELHQALYRNNKDGTFTDVTGSTGLSTPLFGMGVAIGDYDADGFEDVFISGVDKCVLYHNNRNETFSDVTNTSGITCSQWSASAAWFDFDNDGKLDLFVAAFADYSSKRICSLAGSYGGGTGRPTAQSYYCHPKFLLPAASHFYRNLGSGKFDDVSVQVGISKPGKAWGVVATDINQDGFMDLFVSNDTVPNFLWINRGGLRFEDVGLEAGVAYSNDGVPRSGMGVDATDFDHDGRQDLAVGNINAEMTSLYRNLGNNLFDDMNRQTGVGPATRMLSTWGLRFFDYDNDGWPDLVLCNGYPDDTVDEQNNGVTYHQPILLFHNVNGVRIENVSAIAGSTFGRNYSARGLAVGDLNNDGYPDVVFTENGGPPHILMNTARQGANWLGLQLQATQANPAAAGAIISWSIEGRTFSQLKTAGGSYLSSHDSRVVLGVGRNKIDWIEVRWPRPSTRIDRIEHPDMNRYITVKEGQNSVVP